MVLIERLRGACIRIQRAVSLRYFIVEILVSEHVRVGDVVAMELLVFVPGRHGGGGCHGDGVGARRVETREAFPSVVAAVTSGRSGEGAVTVVHLPGVVSAPRGSWSPRHCMHVGTDHTLSVDVELPEQCGRRHALLMTKVVEMMVGPYPLDGAPLLLLLLLLLFEQRVCAEVCRLV